MAARVEGRGQRLRGGLAPACRLPAPLSRAPGTFVLLAPTALPAAVRSHPSPRPCPPYEMSPSSPLPPGPAGPDRAGRGFLSSVSLPRAQNQAGVCRAGAWQRGRRSRCRAGGGDAPARPPVRSLAPLRMEPPVWMAGAYRAPGTAVVARGWHSHCPRRRRDPRSHVARDGPREGSSAVQGPTSGGGVPISGPRSRPSAGLRATGPHSGGQRAQRSKPGLVSCPGTRCHPVFLPCFLTP